MKKELLAAAQHAFDIEGEAFYFDIKLRLYGFLIHGKMELDDVDGTIIHSQSLVSWDMLQEDETALIKALDRAKAELIKMSKGARQSL